MAVTGSLVTPRSAVSGEAHTESGSTPQPHTPPRSVDGFAATDTQTPSPQSTPSPASPRDASPRDGAVKAVAASEPVTQIGVKRPDEGGAWVWIALGFLGAALAGLVVLLIILASQRPEPQPSSAEETPAEPEDPAAPAVEAPIAAVSP